jgi:phage gp36-like protein
MPYSRLADLYNQYGEDAVNQIAETDRTGTPDPLLIKRAITNADAEINAALLTRYRMPISPVPSLIRRISCDLAWWFLHGLTVPESVEDRAKLARDMLKSLASGEMKLEGIDEPAATAYARIEKSREKMRWK